MRPHASASASRPKRTTTSTPATATRVVSPPVSLRSSRAEETSVADRTALLLEVLLVVVLGLVEGGRGDDLGRDALREPRLHLGLRGERLLLLLRRVEEDRGAVLAADVRALAVPLSGVVRAPEEVEQLLVGDDRRIELDLHRLGVAGGVA